MPLKYKRTYHLLKIHEIDLMIFANEVLVFFCKVLTLTQVACEIFVTITVKFTKPFINTCSVFASVVRFTNIDIQC